MLDFTVMPQVATVCRARVPKGRFALKAMKTSAGVSRREYKKQWESHRAQAAQTEEDTDEPIAVSLNTEESRISCS